MLARSYYVLGRANVRADPRAQIKGTTELAHVGLVGLWYTQTRCFQPIGAWQSTHT